jgi:hypothetical protein
MATRKLRGRVDGSRRNPTQNLANDSPDWFVAQDLVHFKPDNNQKLTMNSDGSGQTNLTRNLK